MKRNLLLLILLVFPVFVSAEGNIVGSTILDNDQIKNQVTSLMTSESSLSNVTKGEYVQGVGVTCKNGKNELTVLNGTLSCQNGNSNPYMNKVGDGLSSFASDSSCSDTSNTYYAYGTRVYEYDCSFTGTSPEDKKEYSVSNTATTTKVVNKDDDVTTTTKATGTTENKDTGASDYFVVLTVIGVSLVSVLYVLDKNNVFKRI